MGCCYLLTCTASNKQYIGITKHSAASRFKGHIRDAARGKTTALHNAIRKYGTDSFTVEVLVTSDDREVLCAAEISAISALNTRRPFGYNITGGGEAPWGELNARFGTTHTAETKRKMSENNAMREPIHRVKVSGENHAMYGKQHTNASRELMSTAKRGTRRMVSRDNKEVAVASELVELYIEMGYRCGRKKFSDSHVEAIRIAKLGSKASLETRARMSASQLNRPKMWTEESILNVASGLTCRRELALAHPGAYDAAKRRYKGLLARIFDKSPIKTIEQSPLDIIAET